MSSLSPLPYTFVVHGIVARIIDGGPNRARTVEVAVGDDRITILLPPNFAPDIAKGLQVGQRVVVRGDTDTGPMCVGAINIANELEILSPVFGATSH